MFRFMIIRSTMSGCGRPLDRPRRGVRPSIWRARQATATAGAGTFVRAASCAPAVLAKKAQPPDGDWAEVRSGLTWAEFRPARPAQVLGQRRSRLTTVA